MRKQNSRITILGTTGAGKTCYMVGMYYVMRMGVRGFTFGAMDPDQDLDLADAFEKLRDEEGEQRWPAATADEPQAYHFNFNHGFQRLSTFEWIDYRGGALSDRSTAMDVGDVQDFLRGSDCLIIAMSAEHLIGSDPVSVKASRMKLDRINRYIEEFAQESGPVPVVLMVTKSDLLAGKLTKIQLEELMREMMSPLFSDHTPWRVMLCPVTLGNGLGADPQHAPIEPRRLHLPVAFAVYASMQQDLTRFEGEAEEASAAVWEQSKSFIHRWRNRESIKSKTAQLEEAKHGQSRVAADLSLLTEELKNDSIAQHFYAGERLELR